MPTWRLLLAVMVLAQFGCASSQPRDTLSGLYTHRHEIRYFDGERMHRVDVEDTLRLELTAGGKLKFEIATSSDHGHTCHLSGLASPLSGGGFEHTEEFDLGEGPIPCVLRLMPDGGTVRLEDRGGNCRMYWCGVRGRLHGLEFSRARSTPRRSPGEP